ncbi:hypothetical protein [Streptomyces yangpuensis]|uniref:hypothetical protein n=1 Tax=Streptomyces yangpuensis TaxID=1648182 RepID=UPI002285A163|nr:hypothetical protein [Streptomyces yangpuensis]
MGRRTTGDAGVEPEAKKLDLSVAQVAGSSLATVAAALLASKMGVYGTILGAGVVSVVTTAGGPVIQHLFRRTGGRLRESTRPRARQVPPHHEEGEAAAAAGPAQEFGAATVHGTRMRGWKRTAVASGAAFALAIGGLGTYEALAGTSVSSGGGTLFSGGTRTAGEDPAPPEHGPADGEKGRRGGAGTPGPGTSPTPSRPDGSRSPAPDPGPSRSGEPAPGPSAPTHGPAPTPTPSAPDPAPPTAPSAGGATPSPRTSAP